MKRQRQKSGFTLVEVSLSLLMVGAGVLAAMALFPSGLEANKAAVAETRAAMFADEVLNGLRAQAAVTPWANVNTMVLTTPAADMFKNAPTVTPTATPTTVKYINKFVSGADVVDYAVRYTLRIEDAPGKPLIKQVTLEVWPGEFGPNSEKRVFYTEIVRGAV